MLIFLYLKKISNDVQIEAIKNRIALNIKGGIDFNDSSTNSKVIPQIKVVNTSPDTAKKYVLKLIFFLILLNYEAQLQYHIRLLILS